MKKITFLTCWGTIDKDYWKGKWVHDFKIGKPYIKEIIKNFNITINIEVLEVIKKDSLDMNDDDRILIKDNIKNINNDRIIITHGTDSLIETWKYLQWIKNKIIVLVWASRPWTMNNSDAEFNIGYTLGVLGILSDNKKYWVYVTMNGEYFEVDNVKKWEDWVFRKIN